MRAIKAITLAIALGGACFAQFGQTQCVTCTDLQTLGNGWLESPDQGECGIGCHKLFPAECRSNCTTTLQSVKAANLSPGVIVDQRRGRLWVRSVIPGSPADLAGIYAQDEILAINGKRPGLNSPNTGWGTPTSPKVVHLTLLHNGLQKTTSVALSPLPVLLAKLWAPTTLAGMDSDVFTLGIQWQASADGLLVTSVLRGSEANLVNIQPGDWIIGVNSLLAKNMASSLMPRDHRFAATLQVRRSGKLIPIQLRAGTIYEALDRLNSQKVGPILSLTAFTDPRGE